MNVLVCTSSSIEYHFLKLLKRNKYVVVYFLKVFLNHCYAEQQRHLVDRSDITTENLDVF